MATEKYFPFRSDSGDRRYSADDWAAYFALFLSDGVFYSSADKLKVVANEGMKVKVVSGAGFVAGRMYILETDKIITLDIADGVLNRIDRIVLRCDYANRMITTEVVKGSYSEKPTAPELRRDADVYELALADIYVAAGVVTITTANITDQRLNTALCGIVTGLVKQADTTEIFNQFQAYMLEFMDDKKIEFQTWFDTVKSTLEGDVAGEILNRIEELKNQIGTLSELKTENKTNLVNAINELAEKKPILLESMEEVEANTEPGKQVDGLVIKGLNNSLGGVSQFIVDETTGKITGYKTEIGGADTVFPFRNTDNYYHSQVWTTSGSTNAEVSITETYTAETDCTLAITIVDYWSRNLTGSFISTITKNGEVVETNILYETGLNQISRTIVECNAGDVITAKCGVGAITSSQTKGGYIQIDQIA